MVEALKMSLASIRQMKKKGNRKIMFGVIEMSFLEIMQ